MLRVISARRSTKAAPRKRGRGKRGMRGRGAIWDWVKSTAGKVNSYLRENKVLSKVGDALIGIVPPQYQTAANLGLQGVKLAGYGRRRKTGRGYRLAGGALRLAGARYM